MKRFQPILMIAGFSLLALIGCTSTETSTTETTPAATASSSVATPVTTTNEGNNGLIAVLGKTRDAVTSDNFADAKKEFDKFEDVWKEVEDGIKAKSPDNYESIEKSMDEISGELKASTPQKDKLLTALESLEKTINAVSKS
jgi:hypothetical protein